MSDTQKIQSFLHRSNLDSHKFPWNGVAHNLPKKWRGLIPVKTRGVVRAEQALDRIEEKLGKTLFDRTSIAATPDAQITRGLIVSEGTASAPEMTKDTCGTVSAGPDIYSYPGNFLKPGGEIDTVLYVNLGSKLCDDSTRGKSPSDIAVHEFAHAMGLGDHFQGFGEGPIISDDFWSVLIALYADAPGKGAE